MNYIESLHRYFQNGCSLHPGEPPKFNEIGYAAYIQEKIKEQIVPGDKISLKMNIHDRVKSKQEGIVLEIGSHGLYLLTKGNKIWKDRSNHKHFAYDYITAFEKLADKKPNFDVENVIPKPTEQDIEAEQAWWNEIEQRRTEEFQHQFQERYPDQAGKIALWVKFDFYGCVQDMKKAIIRIVKQDGTEVALPTYSIKKIYPNRNYLTTCNVLCTEEDGGMYVFFDSLQEMKDIKHISCKWMANIHDQTVQFLSILYPEWEDSDSNEKCVYNIRERNTTLSVHEHSLHEKSVFTGLLELYDEVFIHKETQEEDTCIPIKGVPNEDEMMETQVMMDALLLAHDNTLPGLLESICSSDNKEVITEVCIKHITVPAKAYQTEY